VVWQADKLVSEVVTEVPQEHIIDLLTKVKTIRFDITVKAPYEPIEADTSLETSRKVLLFAANNCASGHYDGPRAPLH
jgi:hypothetical protein